MKRYLVTGGSGFLGQALIAKLLQDGHKVTAIARNEGKLHELQQKLGLDHIIFGDISDPHLARVALQDVDGVFHLAGFKYVGAAEKQPKQCIQSNVIGTISLLEAMDRRPYDFVIGISTDKAARVSGIYGASKLMMEALFRQYESYNPQTQYRIVRYGNILYSTGSVLIKWKMALLNGEQLIITDPDATRFFWTVDMAVDLIFRSLYETRSADPFIPQMKAMRMVDLMTAMHEKYGKGELKFRAIGLQRGENLHETMDGITFSNQVEQYTIDEILPLI